MFLCGVEMVLGITVLTVLGDNEVDAALNFAKISVAEDRGRHNVFQSLHCSGCCSQSAWEPEEHHLYLHSKHSLDATPPSSFEFTRHATQHRPRRARCAVYYLPYSCCTRLVFVLP